MSKTPEELAEEYSNSQNCLDDQTSRRHAFLAGYQAAAPQWISIHDKLPQGEDDVLWCNPYSKIMVVAPVNAGFHGNLHESYYTHWMPLPEPPKDDKD